MNTKRIMHAGLAVATVMATSQASAGSLAATVVYAPGGSPVPALGGIGLMVLAFLMSVVAIRLAKQRGRDGTALLVAAVTVTALAAGVSGVKVLGDAYAAPYQTENMESDSGGVVLLDSDTGCYMVVNDTSIAQSIIEIRTEPNFDTEPCNLDKAAVNGGGFELGVCTANPPLLMQPGDSCLIEVFSTFR